MKLPKRHSVALAHMIDTFLGEQFYPFDLAEEEVVTKVVAFMIHHGMLEEDADQHFQDTLKLALPKKKARLDLTTHDVDILLDIGKEVYKDPPTEYKSTVKYLMKEFFGD